MFRRKKLKELKKENTNVAKEDQVAEVVEEAPIAEVTEEEQLDEVAVKEHLTKVTEEAQIADIYQMNDFDVDKEVNVMCLYSAENIGFPSSEANGLDYAPTDEEETKYTIFTTLKPNEYQEVGENQVDITCGALLNAVVREVATYPSQISNVPDDMIDLAQKMIGKYNEKHSDKQVSLKQLILLRCKEQQREKFFASTKNSDRRNLVENTASKIYNINKFYDKRMVKYEQDKAESDAEAEQTKQELTEKFNALFDEAEQ